MPTLHLRVRALQPTPADRPDSSGGERPEWREELEKALGLRVVRLARMGGGASKETWYVEGEQDRLIVRRSGGSVVYSGTLSLRDEYAMLETARAAEVLVPRPLGYLGQIGGREAFAMEHVPGETIGRRIVREATPALASELAEQLAKVHAISPSSVPFLESPDPLERVEADLRTVDEPHPALAYGLRWLRERRPQRTEPCVVLHGDFRIGNVVVADGSAVAVLDWELARLGDAREDLAWPLVRTWRFGRNHLRAGGVGTVAQFLGAYNARASRVITAEELYWWEILGNLRWAVGGLMQARRHLEGLDRSVELAVLGRLVCETEYELLDLIERAP